MYQLKKTLAAGAVIAAFIPGVALAQVTVTNTGPGSTVTVTDSNKCSIQVDNTTGIAIDSNVDQDADSGDAGNTENTNGGNSSSGDASNDSSLNVDFSVNNGTTGSTDSGDDCVFAATPTTPEEPGNGGGGPTPVAPTGNGGGAGGGQVEGASTDVAPAVLPESGVEDVLPALSASALVVGGLAFGSRFALQAYHFVSKK